MTAEVEVDEDGLELRHPDDHEPEREYDGYSSFCVRCGREPAPGE